MQYAIAGWPVAGCPSESLLEPRQPGGCKLKTAPVRPVVAARPAEYVCSEDLFY
ncbi:protease FtsH-inhibitory lysogeny factor CIII [Escherichia coli]|nr:protease FtsH-inhibitory lysogeny factor CIII [Escherichia coli]